GRGQARRPRGDRGGVERATSLWRSGRRRAGGPPTWPGRPRRARSRRAPAPGSSSRRAAKVAGPRLAHRTAAGGALGLAAPHLGGEVLEGVAPEGAVVGQPLVDGPQRAGVERVDPAPALGPDPGEAGVPQHLELLRDGRLGDAELGAYDVDDLARAELALGEQLH